MWVDALASLSGFAWVIGALVGGVLSVLAIRGHSPAVAGQPA